MHVWNALTCVAINARMDIDPVLNHLECSEIGRGSVGLHHVCVCVCVCVCVLWVCDSLASRQTSFSMQVYMMHNPKYFQNTKNENQIGHMWKLVWEWDYEQVSQGELVSFLHNFVEYLVHMRSFIGFLGKHGNFLYLVTLISVRIMSFTNHPLCMGATRRMCHKGNRYINPSV